MENNNNFELKEAFDLFDADGDGQVCLYTYSLLQFTLLYYLVIFAYCRAYFHLGNNSRTGINV